MRCHIAPVSCDLAVVVIDDSGVPLMGHEAKDMISGVAGTQFGSSTATLKF